MEDSDQRGHSMQKKDIIIAIDPDIDGSGLAMVWPKQTKFELHQFTLPALVDFLKECKEAYDGRNLSYVVVVEASYLISSNWHLDHNDTQRRAAAKGKQVGRNHEIGRQIVEFCKYLDIPYEEKIPLKKCWAGKDGKITHEELQMLLEGMGFPPIKGTTNPEKRDALLIALDRSGLPLIMAPAKKKQR